MFPLFIQEAAAGASAAAAEAATEGATTGAASGGLSSLLMIVAMIAIFYFLLIRPQQKRQKEVKKQREAMKEGDHVITAGGIYGKIVGLKDNAIIISIADNVKIKVDKNSVYPSSADLAQEQPLANK